MDPYTEAAEADRQHVNNVIARRSHFQAHPPSAPAQGTLPIHRGWHSRGYLPHFDQASTVQSVTFRLADSIPMSVLGLINRDETPASRRRRIEASMDESHGTCWLSRPEIGDLMEGALLHFDGERYRLCAWCVMPNHVHVLFEPTGTALSKIVLSWKGFTAHEANRRLGRTGTFWEKDYWDRYIRSEEHYRRVVQYIEENPVKAGLTSSSDPREWRWSSARRRDEWGRLPGSAGSSGREA